MKGIVQCCLVTLIFFATTPFLLAQKNATTEKAVADLERQWLKSQQTNNVDLLETLLAVGFTNTSDEGKVTDRTQAIAEAKATKFENVDYTDLKVIVFGDTAIAIGGFKGKGTDPSGNPFDENDRFTDTWKKMSGGKWQCIASAQSAVKK